MREIGVNEYTLINYFDVWGNKKDGWEINDQCIEMNDLSIADDYTDKELCEYLKERKFLNTSDMRRLEVRDDGNYIEILEKKTQKPLYGLVMNYIKKEIKTLPEHAVYSDVINNNLILPRKQKYTIKDFRKLLAKGWSQIDARWIVLCSAVFWHVDLSKRLESADFLKLCKRGMAHL